MTTLDIAIATHTPAGGTRVEKMLLPPMPGIRYVVSWQNHEDAPIPDGLNRTDVTVIRFNESGQSANRNNAVTHCTADIILIGDDDICYSQEALRSVTAVFDNNPSLNLATFRAHIPGKNRYPDKSVALGRRLPKGYSVSAIEIAIRRESLSTLRFNNAIGFGTRYPAGEDEYFLHTAITAGLNCRFYPIVICSHPAVSTGQKTDSATLRGFGCTIALLYPLTSPVRILLRAWRLWRNGKGCYFKILAYLTSGAIGAPGVYLKYRKQKKSLYD